MFQRWTPQSVQFMWDAAQASPYCRELVSIMQPWLGEDCTVCDAGCGIGALSLALAPDVRSVTAWDISPAALAPLRKMAPENLIIRCSDLLEDPEPVTFDVMVFSFFGELDQILSMAQRHCTGTVFAFMKNRSVHRISIKDAAPAKAVYPRSVAALEALGIPFSCGTASLEMGQPLRSLADARQFFEIYNPGSHFSEDELRCRLIAQEDPEFPWYFPQSRDLGWICLNVNDIPPKGAT